MIPHCCYCANHSDFTVQLRNESEQIIGVLYFCNDCRHLVDVVSIDLWKRGQVRMKIHITDVPPEPLSQN